VTRPDDLVHLKGIPPYYQWEDVAQDFWVPITWDMHTKHEELFALSDGALAIAVPGLVGGISPKVVVSDGANVGT